MVTQRQINKLERAINKILTKAYSTRTFACVYYIEIDRDFNIDKLKIRMGTYEDGSYAVATQVCIEHTLTPDVYSMQQSAALCADKGMSGLDHKLEVLDNEE